MKQKLDETQRVICWVDSEVKKRHTRVKSSKELLDDLDILTIIKNQFVSNLTEIENQIEVEQNGVY